MDSTLSLFPNSVKAKVSELCIISLVFQLSNFSLLYGCLSLSLSLLHCFCASQILSQPASLKTELSVCPSSVSSPDDCRQSFFLYSYVLAFTIFIRGRVWCVYFVHDFTKAKSGCLGLLDGLVVELLSYNPHLVSFFSTGIGKSFLFIGIFIASI